MASVLASRSEQFDKVAQMFCAGHEQNILDASTNQFLDRMKDHRPRTHRQEVLVGDLGQIAEAGTFAAGEHNTSNGLHVNSQQFANSGWKTGPFYYCLFFVYGLL